MERKTRLRNFVALQKTRDGRGMDVEQSSRCCCGFLPRIHQAHDFFLLVGSELVASPPKPALLARFIETAARALAQHRTLELGKAGDDLHHHAAAGRSGVNRLGQTAKAGLRLSNFLHQAQHIF